MARRIALDMDCAEACKRCAEECRRMAGARATKPSTITGKHAH